MHQITRHLFSTLSNPSNFHKKLIEVSLKHVGKYGWTDNAILAGCEDMNLSPASHRIISPYNMIEFSMQKWNQESLREIDDSNFGQQKRIRQKVHYAIKVRLSKEITFADTWHQAMAIGAYPYNLSKTSTKLRYSEDLLWDYSDQVWHRCGDRSTDYNYYTKRILFNSAYAATQLHMLTDQSDQKFATWEFLDRRLDDVETIGSAGRNAKVVFGSLGQGLLSIFGAFNRVPDRVQNPIVKDTEQAEQMPEKQMSQQESQVLASKVSEPLEARKQN